MITNLDDIYIFARVVSSGSFAKAARSFGVPTSTISRRMAALEKRLGIALMRRSTRSLSLTEAGRIYLEHSRRIVEDLETADKAVRSLGAEPTGTIRMTLPGEMGDMIWPILNSFLHHHPAVNLSIDASDRLLDLAHEGIDVAIRAGPAPDNYMYRSIELARAVAVPVASPGYLQAHGTPTQASDLSSHDCILFEPWSRSGHWQLVEAGTSLRVPVRGRIRTNRLTTVRDACLGGLGIGLLPGTFSNPWLSEGRLQRVLPDCTTEPRILTLVFPHKSQMSAAVLALIDYIQANSIDLLLST